MTSGEMADAAFNAAPLAHPTTPEPLLQPDRQPIIEGVRHPLNVALLQAALLLQITACIILSLVSLVSMKSESPWISGLEIILNFLVVIANMWILYIVYVQFRYPAATRTQTFRAEMAKSGLSTVVWLGYLIWSLFHWWHGAESAVLGFVVNCHVFYPTLLSAYHQWNEEGRLAR